MNVEVINAGDPLIIVASIPASCKRREEREHEAGLQLLSYGMKLLGLQMGRIRYNNYDKPFFENEQLPFFSISHSCEFVVCSISWWEIGCDIERIKKVPQILDKELNKLFCFCDVEKNDETSRTVLWTIYEAVAKCIGKGIPIDGDSIDYRTWLINSFHLKTNYILSVAMVVDDD